MSNNKIISLDHITEFANVSKRYVLAQILDVTTALNQDLSLATQNIQNSSLSMIENNLSTFVGSTGSLSGVRGLVPAPPIGANNLFLCSDGTWKNLDSVSEEFTNEDVQEILEYLGIVGGDSYYTTPFTESDVLSVFDDDDNNNVGSQSNANDQSNQDDNQNETQASNKTSCNMTLSSTSNWLTLNESMSITVTTPSDGLITATSSNSDYAAVSVEGNTVTITAQGIETTDPITITISQAESNDYLAPIDQIFTITRIKDGVKSLMQ